MKKCIQCGNTKPLSEFHKNRKTKDGLMPHCRFCAKLKSAEWYRNNTDRVMKNVSIWRKNNPEKVKKAARNHHTLKKYGITFDEELALKQKQGNKCAICKETLASGAKSHIDHCHTTGKIRAILCNTCNTMLGMAKDNIDILKSAVKYLKKYSSKSVEK